ncbi:MULTISPECIES: hypothetical protein [unclassified Microcoleus]
MTRHRLFFDQFKPVTDSANFAIYGEDIVKTGACAKTTITVLRLLQSTVA